MADYSKQLSKYIPEPAAPIISQWINDTNCSFKVSKTRSTKLGDYRSPYNGNSHRITVNHDLNTFSFLITTVHEFAHLKTFQDHKHNVKPHGQEWKENFKNLMAPFFKLNIFPDDVVDAIANYMSNPAASSCTDLALFRVLKRYDQNTEQTLHVEDLSQHSIFKLPTGRVFQRGEKLRKRYKCIELISNRTYLIHPLAEVELVKDSLQSENHH